MSLFYPNENKNGEIVIRKTNTFATAVSSNGVFRTTGSQVWMYWALPMSPLREASNDQKIIDAANRITRVINEFALQTGLTFIKNRQMNEMNYRNMHILVANIPTAFRIASGNRSTELGKWQYGAYKDKTIQKRVAFFGIQLNAQYKGKQQGITDLLFGSILEFALSLSTKEQGIESYKSEIEIATDIFSRAGLTPPTQDEITFMQNWWTLGENETVPGILCNNHIHICSTSLAHKELYKLIKDDPDLDCNRVKVPGTYAASYVSVTGLNYDYVDPLSKKVQWASYALNRNAIAISIRARIEPANITRNELKANAKKWEQDIAQRENAGGSALHEQVERKNLMKSVEKYYATSSPNATLHATSILMAMDGVYARMQDIMPHSNLDFALLPTADEQKKAWKEMLIASPIQMNPHLLEIPAQTLGYSGISDLSGFGKSNVKGALLGFTEGGNQPVYINPHDSREKALKSIMLLVGRTGSGKSAVLNFLGEQFSLMPSKADSRKSPVVLIEYGKNSGLIGDNVITLDDIQKADGIFDPIKCMQDKETGASLASSMLASIFEIPDDEAIELSSGLLYGVENGATCTGEALEMAQDASGQRIASFRVDKDRVRKIKNALSGNPLFKVIFGTDETSTALTVQDGLTLITSGQRGLQLPQNNSEKLTMEQRISLWVMRMSVLGSFNSMRGRGGTVMLDEAHLFLKGADTRDLIEETARLARSENVFFVMASQRMKDFVDAQIGSYVSKCIMLPSDAEDTKMVLEMFNYENIDDVLYRVSGAKFLGDTDKPNWNSTYALVDHDNNRLLRGSVPFYITEAGTGLFTECNIPKRMLDKISIFEKVHREQQESKV